MRYLMLAVATLFLQHDLCAQAVPALLVTAEFTGSGTYHCVYGMDGSYVRLAVRNNTAATRTFFVMSCSWRECWSINKTIVYFPMLSCERNIPQEIKLEPKQEIIFYTFVQLYTKAEEADVADITKKFQDKKNEIRFAFTEITNAEAFYDNKKWLANKMGKTYWSEPIPIAFPDNSYQVK